MTAEEETALQSVLAAYGLDDASLRLYRISIGGANEKYAVLHKGERYFLRKSGEIALLDVQRSQTRRQQLEFQAELLRYLEEKGFALTPRVYLNREGGFVTGDGQDQYMLFSFVEGERKGDWNDLRSMTPQMTRNFFFALGELAKAVEGFSPRHATRENTLLDYARSANRLLGELVLKIPPRGRDLVMAHEPELKAFAGRTEEMLAQVGYEALPRQVIHFDYHAGNVHFEGERVSAIVDLDWARLDNRFVDLATALSMSCPFGGSRTGMYSSSMFQTAFDAYNAAFGPTNYSLREQKEITKASLRAYVFFQLLYDLDYWVRKKDPGIDVIRYQLNTVLANDFDALFGSVH